MYLDSTSPAPMTGDVVGNPHRREVLAQASGQVTAVHAPLHEACPVRSGDSGQDVVDGLPKSQASLQVGRQCVNGVIILDLVLEAELWRAKVLFQAAGLEVDGGSSSKGSFRLQERPHEGP